jgi:hypothetical protein
MSIRQPASTNSKGAPVFLLLERRKETYGRDNAPAAETTETGSLRTPNFEPGQTFFSSERFQVVPFADGLRIAHSFGKLTQSLFA